MSSSAISSIESVEDVPLILFRNPASVVSHDDATRVDVMLDRHVDRARPARIFDRIVEQVKQRAPQQFLVAFIGDIALDMKLQM